MAFQRADRHQRAQAEAAVRAIADLVQPRDALDVEHVPGFPDSLAPANQHIGRTGDNARAFLLAHHVDGLLHRPGFPVGKAVHGRSPISQKSLGCSHPIILPMWTRYNSKYPCRASARLQALLVRVGEGFSGGEGPTGPLTHPGRLTAALTLGGCNRDVG